MIFDLFDPQEAFDKFGPIASPIATQAGTETPEELSAPHVHLAVKSGGAVGFAGTAPMLSGR